jgi:uncharacterized protein
MRIVIAGSSGFLGTHLTTRFREDGHDVTRLVRREASAPDEARWDPAAGVLDRDLIKQADVVINVAGSPTVGNPHSKRWARELRESRVATTALLAETIAGAASKPAFLANNAVGYYGDHGSALVTEATEPSSDSLMSGVCRDWQDAAAPAERAGARVCVLRTAPVMDRTAPPLKQLRPLFRLGLGARLGDGSQHMPMVSLRDWLGAVARLAEDASISGPVNISAPTTPTNAEFTKALAKAVHRPAFVFVPSPVLSLGAGPAAPELLGSINVSPAVLEAAGYQFQDRDVDAVLAAGLR